MKKLTVPITDEEIVALAVGDQVSLSGVIVTARDRAHKFIVENFINRQPPEEERELYEELKHLLDGGVIYHCGPVVGKFEGNWKFVSAGPTTSIRTDVYQDKVIEHFNVKAVIGKGGMGLRTLKACQDFKAVYLHAIGGAGVLIASTVKEVVSVYKLEQFGMPEAFWVVRVEDFPAVVTMDSHGESLHENVERASLGALRALLA